MMYTFLKVNNLSLENEKCMDKKSLLAVEIIIKKKENSIMLIAMSVQLNMFHISIMHS